MPIRPITFERLVAELTDRIGVAPRERPLRVAIDGAPGSGTAELADALAGPLRALGRDTVRVSARNYLRPASLRYEFGRDDPDLFYDAWLDVPALLREVLSSARVLPGLWDPDRDRATRADYVELSPAGVVLLDGPLLLGRALPFDLTVHLSLSPAALARRTTPAWTLPAYARHVREADPVRTADYAVKMDDPRHPALLRAP